MKINSVYGLFAHERRLQGGVIPDKSAAVGLVLERLDRRGILMTGCVESEWAVNGMRCDGSQ